MQGASPEMRLIHLPSAFSDASGHKRPPMSHVQRQSDHSCTLALVKQGYLGPISSHSAARARSMPSLGTPGSLWRLARKGHASEQWPREQDGLGRALWTCPVSRAGGRATDRTTQFVLSGGDIIYVRLMGKYVYVCDALH